MWKCIRHFYFLFSDVPTFAFFCFPPLFKSTILDFFPLNLYDELRISQVDSQDSSFLESADFFMSAFSASLQTALQGFHSCAVHLDTVVSFIYPADTQLDCSKNV
jgi:hypothetical protein